VENQQQIVVPYLEGVDTELGYVRHVDDPLLKSFQCDHNVCFFPNNFEAFEVTLTKVELSLFQTNLK
jgi:hypothetical protein